MEMSHTYTVVLDPEAVRRAANALQRFTERSAPAGGGGAVPSPIPHGGDGQMMQPGGSEATAAAMPRAKRRPCPARAVIRHARSGR